jgi:DNA-binding transcriptional MocR family regulator
MGPGAPWLFMVFYAAQVPVDHGSPVPPYRQVANELRARIESGDLAPGARVPSITTLMQEYGIAATPPGTRWQSWPKKA